MDGRTNAIGIVIHCSNPNESNNSSRVENGETEELLKIKLEFDILLKN